MNRIDGFGGGSDSHYTLWSAINPPNQKNTQQLDANQAVQVKKATTDGYDAVQLGAGSKKPKRVSQPERGHFDRWLDGNQEGPAKRKLWEFRVTPNALLAPGACDDLDGEGGWTVCFA